MWMYFVVFPLLTSVITEGAAVSLSLTSCEAGWSDGTSVGLGCLYFERGESMTYSDAKQYCNNRDSNLLELETEDQME